MSKPQRTEAQAAAARANGARSGGPVSSQGKAASSRNAVRHGLCSDRLPFDDPAAMAEYERVRAGLVEAFIPSSPAEEACLEAMAFAKWREGVAIRMEVRLLEAVDAGEACCMAGGLGLPSLNTLMRYRARIEREYDRARAELEDLRRHRVKPDVRVQPADLPMDKAFDDAGTNEPGDEASDTLFAGLNRESRRRLEAQARKTGKARRPKGPRGSHQSS